MWGGTDQFHGVWQPLTGDGNVSAHVTSQTNSDPLAKAGVMLRQSTDAGSPYYAIVVTPGNSIDVQYRASWGARQTWADYVTLLDGSCRASSKGLLQPSIPS